MVVEVLQNLSLVAAVVVCQTVAVVVVYQDLGNYFVAMYLMIFVSCAAHSWVVEVEEDLLVLVVERLVVADLYFLQVVAVVHQDHENFLLVVVELHFDFLVETVCVSDLD